MNIIKIHSQNLSAFRPLLNPNYYRQLQSGLLEAFGAVDEGVAAGILVFGIKREGIFLLHELVVAPSYRRRGIAAKLLRWFTELSLDEGALILASFDDKPDSPVAKMLQKSGFTITDSAAKSASVPVEALRGITVLDHIKYTKQVKPVAFEDQLLWRRFYRKQEKQKNLLLSACYDPAAAPELNLCIRSGMEIAGCVTGCRLSEEMYELSHACAEEKQSWALMPLLAVFRDNLLKMAEPSARLHITGVTNASVGLMEKLLPDGCTYVGRKRAVWGNGMSSGSA